MPVKKIVTRIRRAAGRDDPRLAVGVGAAVSFLVAFLFAFTDAGPIRRIELSTLDVAFSLAPPAEDSGRILNVDMDDNTLRVLPQIPFPRDVHGQVIRALDALGADQIVFDVEFKHGSPPSFTAERKVEEYDATTGEPLMAGRDLFLQRSIGLSGKVVLAYHFEVDDPISRPLRLEYDKLRAALAKDLTLGSTKIAEATGITWDLIDPEVETLRRTVAEDLVGEVAAKAPSVTLAQLCERFLSGKDRSRHRGEEKLLQASLMKQRSMADLERNPIAVRVEGAAPRAAKHFNVGPIFVPFLRAASDAGTVNIEHDPDGVIRRVPLYTIWKDKVHFYLGLKMALRALETEKRKVEVVIRPDEVEILVLNRADGEIDRTMSVPTDETGSALVVWEGTTEHPRGDLSAHLPYIVLKQYYEERFENLDQNYRGLIAQLASPPDYALLYLDLSDLMRTAYGDAKVPEGGREQLEETLDKLCRVPPKEREKFLEIARFMRRPGLPKRQLEGMGKALDAMMLPADRALSRREIVAWIGEEMEGLRRRIRDGVAAGLSGKETTPELENLGKFFEQLESFYLGLGQLERELRPVVEGKICIIGSASTAGGDLHPTPLSAKMPGVDVHANIGNMVLTDQFALEAPPLVNFVFIFLSGLAVSFAVVYLHVRPAILALVGTLIVAVCVALGSFSWAWYVLSGAGPFIAAIFSFGFAMAFKELFTRRSQRKLKKEMAVQTSAELVEMLMKHPDLVAKPRRVNASIYFSDVKGFTALSEGLEPEALIGVINRYLDQMTRVLMSRNAYVDKYIGDGIMVLFGVPVQLGDHARRACDAALECQAALKVLNMGFQAEGLPALGMRVGINTGDIVVGYLGSKERANYTAMGDPVNLASRLESAGKQYGVSILVSGATREQAGEGFRYREADNVRVVGKKVAVRIFELVCRKGDKGPYAPGFLDLYDEAMRLFHDRKFDEAQEKFEQASKIHPEDKLAKMYVGRCEAFAFSPPGDDWKGEFELTSK